jgi:hypothetical protein
LPALRGDNRKCQALAASKVFEITKAKGSPGGGWVMANSRQIELAIDWLSAYEGFEGEGDQEDAEAMIAVINMLEKELVSREIAKVKYEIKKNNGGQFTTKQIRAAIRNKANNPQKS